MKTVYIFPGLNGLLRKADRLRFIDYPEVQSYFSRSERVLKNDFGMNVNLVEFLHSSTENIYAIENISLAAVAITATQCGVAEHLRQKLGTPDWVMGCSLGDLARAVFAKAYTFEDAIFNHVYFTQKIDGIDKIGGNIGVLAGKGKSFSDEDHLWFDSIEVDVSQLTPRFLNIGGRFEDLKKVEERARQRGWGVMQILNYPAHSRYIVPYVNKVEADMLRVRMLPPQTPMFSSFSVKPLTDCEEIKSEFILSMTKTIHWHRAVTKLVQDHEVSRFINIGPCRSLSGLMKDIPVHVEMLESFNLV
ncbi:acyltransferase domain-containing protein [Bdellovibrio sp. ArHS]|uniref:acyltransferase domain-containing protein n=1 Tax=Bdellovibrio sp. ArHS TaxID=1569284 RepID=UPI000A7F1CFE|nr:acyltransferase domain-containing protein [Bdellovibrio sp. ArHS]